MKLIRLLILFGNISLIILIAYLGYYFFLKGVVTRDRGYFEYIQIVAEPIEDLFPKEPPKTIKGEGEYTAISAWLGPREPEVEDIPPPPPEQGDLDRLYKELQIKSVVYNSADPSRSGVHVIIGGIGRFFLSGDNERLSPTLDFVLASVKEIKPNEEYVLTFKKGDNKIVELQYRKPGR